MSLKTDYRNDKFAGKRKYILIENGDGTVSLEDVTSYETVGDIFNADDINSTNKAVNANADGIQNLDKNTNLKFTEVKKVRYATVSASKWSSTAPYTQIVSVPGIEAADTPIISLYLSSSVNANQAKVMGRAYGYLDRAVTGNGTITLYCYNSKPDTDFQIAVKGE